MNKHNLSLASFLLACHLLCFFQTAGALKTYYLLDQCAIVRNINIELGSPVDKANSSVILKSSLANNYRPRLKCVVRLTPKGTSGVILSIRKIDFRMGCQDNITFTDASGWTQKLCGYMMSSDEEWSYYTNGPMTLTFESGNGTLAIGGFELTATTFRSSPCQSSDFKCKNNRCIWEGLKCDGHNHCGDRSDQNCGITVGGIVGTVFGCIFLVIAIVAGFFYCRSRRTVITTYQQY